MREGVREGQRDQVLSRRGPGQGSAGESARGEMLSFGLRVLFFALLAGTHGGAPVQAASHLISQGSRLAGLAMLSV